MNASSVRVAWQWSSSGPAPGCFNTTRVTYHPEGGGESSLQLRDPAATETILTDLQSNTCYTITVVATAGKHRREIVKMMAIDDASLGVLDSNQVQVFVGGQVTILYIGNYFRKCYENLSREKLRIPRLYFWLCTLLHKLCMALFRYFERWTSSLTPVLLKQPRVSKFECKGAGWNRQPQDVSACE